MLIGIYSSSLNSQRRVAIPSAFRKELGEKIILAKWYEDCLLLVSISFLEALLKRLTGGSRVASLGVRDIERFILGSSFEIEPDPQGRVVIPEILVNFAGIEQDLMFLGLGDRAEIWSKEKWLEKAKEIEKTSKEYVESLAKNEK